MTEQELANVIWDIKEVIRNSYDDSEVEDVILPFTLLRRLDCVLEDKYETILEELNKCEENLKKYKLQALMKKNGITFFNMSGLSLKKLLNAPDHIGNSFKTYIEGFTDNVKDILANFVHEDGDSEVVDLSKIYARLDRGNKLYAVIQQFVENADLHPSKVSNAMMGTIFEIVIRRSKESTNTKAGQYYTPREVVKLLVSLTMCGKEQELFIPGKAFTIYDPCCGTGGMLTVGREHMQYGANEPAESDDTSFPRYIRITDITANGELRPETFKSLEPSKAKDYLLDKGDVLFARSGATVGKTFLFNADIK